MLRALWTERSVTVDGRFHHITAAGLAPLPVQRPIPIWIGAFAPAALRRVGRVADGWFPQVRPRRRAGGGARDHPRRCGRGRPGPLRVPVRGTARVRRPRPRQDRRARPALARGRSDPPLAQHDARRLEEHRRAHRRAGRDGRGSALTRCHGGHGRDALCGRSDRACHHARCRTSRPRTPVPTSRSRTIAREWGRIGCTGFGGPPTHIAMLRRLAVERERLARRDRVRGRHRGHQSAPGSGLDPAGHLLRLAAAGRAGRTGRRACFICPGLAAIIVLAAVFLAGQSADWIKGAALGAGAAVAPVALGAAIGLVPASWRRAGAVRGAAGALGRSTPRSVAWPRRRSARSSWWCCSAAAWSRPRLVRGPATAAGAPHRLCVRRRLGRRRHRWARRAVVGGPEGRAHCRSAAGS